MRRAPVESAAVASVGYDAEACVLEVEFRNGRVYRYLDVPAAVHRLLMNATSVGDFVNTVVKPRFEAVSV